MLLSRNTDSVELAEAFDLCTCFALYDRLIQKSVISSAGTTHFNRDSNSLTNLVCIVLRFIGGCCGCLSDNYVKTSLRDLKKTAEKATRSKTQDNSVSSLPLLWHGWLCKPTI